MGLKPEGLCTGYGLLTHALLLTGSKHALEYSWRSKIPVEGFLYKQNCLCEQQSSSHW